MPVRERMTVECTFSKLGVNQLAIDIDLKSTGGLLGRLRSDLDLGGFEFVQNLSLEMLKFWTVASPAAVNNVDFHSHCLKQIASSIFIFSK